MGNSLQYMKELLLNLVTTKGKLKNRQDHISKKSMKEEPWQDDVPMEIFCTIFGSFSITNIRTIRGVCKSWRSMVDSRDFVKFWNLQHKNRKELLLVPLDKKCRFSRAEDGRVTSFYLAASSHSLLCFTDDNNKNLVICNPITRHGRRISLPNRKTIESVGLYYHPNNDTYKVIAVRKDDYWYQSNYNLITEIYDSVTKTWEYQCKFNSHTGLKKTSPIVWYEGCFTWILGKPHGLQMLIRFNESNKTWEPFGKTTEPHLYGHLHVNNNKLVIDNRLISCNKKGNVVIGNVIEGNMGHWWVGLTPAKDSGWSLHRNDNHQCKVPSKLFKQDYLVPRIKHCKQKPCFAFSPCLATV